MKKTLRTIAGVALIALSGAAFADESAATAASSRKAGAKKSVTIKRKASNREILARLRKYRGVLPADFKFNRNDAYGDDERRGHAAAQPCGSGRVARVA